MSLPAIARPTSHELQPGFHIVQHRGAMLIVQGESGKWKIRREGTTGVIHTLTEKHGLGKEEAIDWIERNY